MVFKNAGKLHVPYMGMATNKPHALVVKQIWDSIII